MHIRIGTVAVSALVLADLACYRDTAAVTGEDARDPTTVDLAPGPAPAVPVSAASRECEERRASEPVQCESQCLQQSLCVHAALPVDPTRPDGPRRTSCVECLEDAHCRANPFAAGPRCHEDYHVCMCGADADCDQCFPGQECLETGTLMPPLCGCAELGPSGSCPPGMVCNGVACKRPCQEQDCPGRCDQRGSSPTFGLCVDCLSDNTCDPASDRPRCVPEVGQCGCNSDEDCAGKPTGARCIDWCIHHPGVGSCDSSCGCEDQADCPAGTECDGIRCKAP